MELIEALLRAFFVGGLICAVGQLLIDYTPLTPARILVSFVVLGVVLGGIGIYQPLLDFAGAGASVPLTGFGALLAKGVRTPWRNRAPSESSPAGSLPPRAALPLPSQRRCWWHCSAVPGTKHERFSCPFPHRKAVPGKEFSPRRYIVLWI